jgi:LysR family transcriptional regulator, glycine cleavage system transcriptional activator
MDWSGLPSLSSLRAFESAARHRNFTAAGRELNVSHAAVIQQVRRLEVFLHTPLLHREGAGLSLTREGASLAARLSEGFGVVRDAVSSLMVDEAARPLHLSMTPSFAVSWLMPRLASFRAGYPDIELMLNPSVEVVDVKGGAFDLAIRFGKGDWPGLEVELLVPSAFVVVAARHLVDRTPVAAHEDLMQLPWLHELGNDELTRWLAARGVRVENKHNVTHLPGYLLRSAILDCQGVGCMARVFVEDDIRAGRLVVLFEDDASAPTGYHLVYQPGVMRPALKAFVTWIRRTAGEETGRGQG